MTSATSAGPIAMSVELQEYCAMNELLFVLLGKSSDHVELYERDSILDQKFFGVSVSDVVAKLVPIGESYKRLELFLTEKMNIKKAHGLVMQAFCSALMSLKNDFESVVIDMEQEFRQDTLTLPKMTYYLQNPSIIFSNISRLLDAISTKKLHGCGIILALEREGDQARSDKSLKWMYDFLLESSIRPILLTIERWISQGILVDPYKEFFVLENERLSKEDLSEDFNATYWNEKFSLVKEKIPICFAKVAQKILLSGKYLNVLRECGSPIVHQPLTLALEFRADFSAQESLLLHEKIEGAHKIANESLLKFLVDKYDLYRKLESTKNVFFMHYGDVFSHFLDINEGVLATEAESINLEMLQGSLELCFKASGTSQDDPYCTVGKNSRKGEDYGKNCHYQVAMSRTSLTDQLMKIANMSATDESQMVSASSSTRDTMLSGWLALNIECPIEYPLSILMSLKSVTKYQMLFRHLFSSFCLTRQLNMTLTPQSLPTIRLLETRFDVLRSALSRLRALKYKMEYFLAALTRYFHMDVLLYHWNEWSQKSKSLSSLEEFLSEHSRFLDCCLKECLITNWKLFRILTKLFSVCQVFVTYCNTRIIEELSDFEKIEEIDGTFMRQLQASVFKQIVKIEMNFSFHIKLLIHTLQFFSTTDFDHRIGSLIFQLEHGFLSNEDLAVN